MKRLFALLLALACCALCQPTAAAQSIVDSLKRAAQTARTPAAKAEALCDLCYEFYAADENEAALRAGREGLRYARQAGDDNTAGTCLKYMAATFENASRYDSALTAYEESIALFKKANNLNEYARAIKNKADLLAQSGQYLLSIKTFNEAEPIIQQTNDPELMAEFYNSLAIVSTYQGKYAEALAYYQKSLKLFEAENDLEGKSAVLNNIGDVHLENDEFEIAISYFTQSREIEVANGNELGAAQSDLSLGVAYEYQKNFDEALRYYQKALKVFRSRGEDDFVSSVLNNIANIYAERGKHEKALEIYQESVLIDQSSGNDFGTALTLINMADSRLQIGQLAAARDEAREALRLARLTGLPEAILYAAEVVSQTDSALGDWKAAYEHYKLFKRYGDTLDNASQAKEIGRLEAEYKFEKEIEQRERQEADAAERRMMLYWIAAGVFAALLLAAGLLAWGFRTKQKANRLLASQNAEITQQSEEISQQRDELQAMNEQITEQRDALGKAHEAITDSVQYAARIQRALLPSVEAMRQNADVYVYYKARDVVSGDFYWTHRIDEETCLYAAVDCTGHGVPGAFMSVLGSTTLDTIVREHGETRPDQMLALLDQNIRAVLKQDDAEDGALDGMDVALIRLDKKNRKLLFSAAGRPLFLLRNEEIFEYKGAKFPAGGAQHSEKDFPLVEIDLEPGDRVFLCSDGVTDQFGGPLGRKFTPRRLKETLLAHRGKDLQTQGAAFSEVFLAWQKARKQLDDQLLLALAV